MITVIADDITGAAEISGIALRHNLNTVMTTNQSTPPDDTDVFVIATDTRSGSCEEAAQSVAEIARRLPKDGNCIFKKTDSAMRGHIVAELDAIMDNTEYTHSLLLPQNPTKGRVIKDGVYYIDNTPLADTAFSYDPEFPVSTSLVNDILGGNACILTTGETDMHNCKKRICIAEATSTEEVAAQLAKADNNCLIAGGADIFNALLHAKYPKAETKEPEKGKITPREHSLIVCGSTQSTDIADKEFARKSHTVKVEIPEDVFNGANCNEWISSLSNIYPTHNSVAITIGQKKNGGPECAARLRRIMGKAVKSLAGAMQPGLLIIEGGATAYAIINELGWSNFKIRREYAPGIVGMTFGDTEIILKPGSYPWGGML